MHGVLNTLSDTFTSARCIPDGNPLVVGGGGLVGAAILLAVVSVGAAMRSRRMSAVHWSTRRSYVRTRHCDDGGAARVVSARRTPRYCSSNLELTFHSFYTFLRLTCSPTTRCFSVRVDRPSVEASCSKPARASTRRSSKRQHPPFSRLFCLGQREKRHGK